MKHDWIKIKDEYISAKSEALRTSLDSLASKYGVSQNYLRTKATTLLNCNHSDRSKRHNLPIWEIV